MCLKWRVGQDDGVRASIFAEFMILLDVDVCVV